MADTSVGEMATEENNNADALVTSIDPLHPANHICTLCYQFYGHGWVTGTGGGISIKHGDHVYLAPSGVQKELMKPQDIFVMDYVTKQYLRRPPVGYGRLCAWRGEVGAELRYKR